MKNRYKIGDKVVKVGIGIGTIRSIEVRNNSKYYTIDIITLCGIPRRVVLSSEEAKLKIRSIVNQETVKRIYEELANKESKVYTYSECKALIIKGNPISLAKLISNFHSIKNIGFQELNLYELAYALLVQELAIAENTFEHMVERRIFEALETQ